MTVIHTRSRVGPDGNVVIPVGVADAGAEVIVTVKPADPAAPPPMTREEWLAFIERTAGSWVGDFERPPQGEYEEREGFD